MIPDHILVSDFLSEICLRVCFYHSMGQLNSAEPLFIFSYRVVFLLQVSSELHGGRPRRFHARKSPQWHAHHHPTPQVHGANADHVPSGQKTQAGVPATHGGGRGAGEQAGGGGPSGGSVSGVGFTFLLSLLQLFLIISMETIFCVW